jgi:peroxiredoxin
LDAHRAAAISLPVTDATPPTVGERARPFDMVDLEGRRVRLDDLRGQAFLLIFLRHAS